MDYPLSRKEAMECLEQLVCAKLDKTGNYIYVSKSWQSSRMVLNSQFKWYCLNSS